MPVALLVSAGSVCQCSFSSSLDSCTSSGSAESGDEGNCGSRGNCRETRSDRGENDEGVSISAAWCLTLARCEFLDRGIGA